MSVRFPVRVCVRMRVRVCVCMRAYAIYATLNGNALTICSSHGASIEAKNKTGAMVWDYAIESTDSELLKALVQVYKETKGISEKGRHLFKGT